eukprot:CCRYP_013147-RF/>CCRYP_013147-RF protein AED:0.42 eAED:0.39 QI:0/-1/0/1/-1/1/1/0/309
MPWEPYPIKYGNPVQQTLPQDNSPLKQATNHTHSTNRWFIPILRSSHRSHHSSCSQRISNTTIQCNGKHAKAMPSLPRVYGISSGHMNLVLRIKHDSQRALRRKLPLRQRCQKQDSRYFLPRLPPNTQPTNSTQWCRCRPLHTTKTRRRLCGQGRTWSPLPQSKEAKIIRLTLEELGHPQPPTPIHCGNSTTVGIVNNTVKCQKSQSMEMRYFWLLDRHVNKLFDFQYHPGLENLADYPSKAHPGGHHLTVRPQYVHMSTSPRMLPRAAKPSVRRGCADKVGLHHLRKYPIPTLTPVPRGTDHMPAAAT